MGISDYHAVRQRVVARDGPNCHWCRRLTIPRRVNGALDKRRTLDHVIPRSKDGSDDISNLVIACFRCNNERGSMSVEVWTLVVADRSVLPALRRAQGEAWRVRGVPMMDGEIVAFLEKARTKEAARSDPGRPESSGPDAHM